MKSVRSYLNGKKIYLNLYSNKENLDIILLNKEGDIIGLLNATFIESKKINNLPQIYIVVNK